MHHPTLAIPRPNLRRHIYKALNFAMHITVRDIAAIFTPFTGEDTLGRGIGWHGRNRVADERELAFLVQPGAAPAAGGEELVLEGGVDYADDGAVLDDEADGDAEHGEEVSVIDGSCGVLIVGFCLRLERNEEGVSTVKRIDAPCWLFVD